MQRNVCSLYIHDKPGLCISDLFSARDTLPYVHLVLVHFPIGDPEPFGDGDVSRVDVPSGGYADLLFHLLIEGLYEAAFSEFFMDGPDDVLYDRLGSDIHEQDEFVSSESAGLVVLAYGFLQYLRHFHEHFVPYRMPEGIVYGLEIIYIYVDDGVGVLVYDLVEILAVVETCEGIPVDLVDVFDLHTDELAHVPLHEPLSDAEYLHVVGLHVSECEEYGFILEIGYDDGSFPAIPDERVGGLERPRGETPAFVHEVIGSHVRFTEMYVPSVGVLVSDQYLPVQIGVEDIYRELDFVVQVEKKLERTKEVVGLVEVLLDDVFPEIGRDIVPEPEILHAGILYGFGGQEQFRDKIRDLFRMREDIAPALPVYPRIPHLSRYREHLNHIHRHKG